VDSILIIIIASGSAKALKKMETSDVVVLTGATGCVGQRVVNILRKKGLPVRLLVFNL
jgi:NADP-dependent 3-hydroxy acid dehydrogenase YdfG